MCFSLPHCLQPPSLPSASLTALCFSLHPVLQPPSLPPSLPPSCPSPPPCLPLHPSLSHTRSSFLYIYCPLPHTLSSIHSLSLKTVAHKTLSLSHTHAPHTPLSFSPPSEIACTRRTISLSHTHHLCETHTLTHTPKHTHRNGSGGIRRCSTSGHAVCVRA